MESEDLKVAKRNRAGQNATLTQGLVQQQMLDITTSPATGPHNYSPPTDITARPLNDPAPIVK